MINIIVSCVTSQAHTPQQNSTVTLVEILASSLTICTPSSRSEDGVVLAAIMFICE